MDVIIILIIFSFKLTLLSKIPSSLKVTPALMKKEHIEFFKNNLNMSE